MESKKFLYSLQVPSKILKPVSKAVGVVVVFHGYAQMPNDLDLLSEVFLGENFVVLQLQAPHAFSTPRGKIVSTWMSKFNREAEIQAQVAYLNQVNDYLLLEFPQLPCSLIGFSQGAVVAYRAFFMSRMNIANCFCVAGDLPPEIKSNIAMYESRKYGRIQIFGGSEDLIVPLEKLKDDQHFLQSHGYDATLHSFVGKHEVPLELIKQLLKKL